MSFAEASNSYSRRFQHVYDSSQASESQMPPPAPPPFDLPSWFPHMQNCQKYFVEVAQFEHGVQALALFMNIALPCQKVAVPNNMSSGSSPRSAPPSVYLRQSPMSTFSQDSRPASVSLTPYIRRMIVTGFDTPEMLHGFFGDEWLEGVGRIHEIERRNYLFAAKSESWLTVKSHYDMNAHETAPFMKPLQQVSESEIAQAELQWGDWLAMQDWMVGPRAPGTGGDDDMAMSPPSPNRRIKREPRG